MSVFDYFVVLAGMRTGSNLLEEQLAAMPGVDSYGELFNPHFFGKPGTDTKWDLSMAARNSDPVRVIGAMRDASDSLPGFRLFYDHDDRVISHVLADKRAAKIVLTRRPIDSYVSLKIARKTGQWWLGDLTSARAAKVPFDAAEYAEFLDQLDTFQSRIARSLQTSGQTAFHISYDDLSDHEVLAGLGMFIGSDGPPDVSKVRAKVQNPKPVATRLTNPTLAEEALSTLSTVDLGHIPNYEPDRGPGLRFFRVGQTAPLIYMPIRGAWEDPVPEWLKSVDPNGKIEGGMTQKDMRRWKRQHPGHRSFTVLRHPLLRVHDAFCRFILPKGVENFADIRAALTDQYDVPLPSDGPGEGYDLEQHQHAFLAFLRFLSGNLGGQTSLRVDNSWASQAVLLHAIGEFVVPDRVIRSDTMDRDLPTLACEVGLEPSELAQDRGVVEPFALEEVCTPAIEKACETAYNRDYIMFGFAAWRAE